MPPLTAALRDIERAQSADAVLEVVRQFLTELSLTEHTELPWGLAPELIQTPADVALWALHFQAGKGDFKVGPSYGRVAKLLKEAGHRFLALRGATA